MKILHTSDLHLRDHRDARWKALERVLEVAERESVEVVTVGGDLFDSEAASEKLRPWLSHTLSNRPFNVVILPGNHDKDCYKEGIYLGERTYIIRDHRKPLRLGDVTIWGMPFSHTTNPAEMLKNIGELMDEEGFSILLYHGELLDATGLWDEFGEEPKRYMPISLSLLKEVKFDYILAGHLHSRLGVWEAGKGWFVYPGSPVSITKKELGKRKVALIETGKPPKEMKLDTFHFERLALNLDPENDRSPLEIVKEALSSVDKSAQALVNIEGYIDTSKIGMSEEELAKSILRETDRIGIPRDSVEVRIVNISHILQDPIYISFKKKLRERNMPEERRDRILNLLIKAMRGVR